MTKNILTGALTGISLILAMQTAQANDGFYVSGALGNTWTEDSDYKDDVLSATGKSQIDNTIGFFIAGGKEFNKYVRGELELSYRKADVDNVDGIKTPGLEIETTALMINGYFNLLPDAQINPYISGGLGIADQEVILEIAGSSISNDDTAFAYQVGGGLNYDINDNISLFTDYRYFQTADFEISTAELEYAAHELRAGVRYTF